MTTNKKTKLQIIAEVAQAHDGSLGVLHSYIDAVAKTGVDAIKFQTHIADAESSQFEPFRVKFSYEDKSRYNYWKRMEFTMSQWKEIKSHCDNVGLEFMSSPFSVAAVEMLEEIGVKRYKIPSGEISNKLLLNQIVNTNKDIILSTGLTDLEELKEIVTSILAKGRNKLSLLQCTTKYPTKPHEVGLNIMTEYRSLFPGVDVGLSDHSGEIFPSLAAIALGASIIECHVVFSKDLFGPDAKASLTIDQFSELVKGGQFISNILSNPINKTESLDVSLKNMFGKSLSVSKSLKCGDKITVDCLESKKPAGYGIDASHYESILNKKVRRDMKKYEFLNIGDLQ